MRWSVAFYEKKPQDALHEYRLALELLERDETPEAQVLKARVLRGAADAYYLELRDMKNAVQVYRELIRECPEAPETLEGRIHLADILHSHYRDLRGAINELTAALARNPPQSAELKYRVAKLYFELGDYQQCEIESIELTKKYETSPFVDDALFLRAQALAMMEGRRDVAMRAFQDVADKYPDSELQPHAMFELGKLRADSGDYEKAIEAWVEALKRHPDPHVVQTVIARVRKRMLASAPHGVGDESKAFDRESKPVAAVAMPKTSVEAAGGSAAEAAHEQNMPAEKGGEVAPAKAPAPAPDAAKPPGEAL
jgi:tetratricopeptide (TPR) repeat protein